MECCAVLYLDVKLLGWLFVLCLFLFLIALSAEEEKNVVHKCCSRRIVGKEGRNTRTAGKRITQYQQLAIDLIFIPCSTSTAIFFFQYDDFFN